MFVLRSADNVVKLFWEPMLKWTNQTDSIPYTNFNDFLHYS
jgi:hypothetical protein